MSIGSSSPMRNTRGVLADQRSARWRSMRPNLADAEGYLQAARLKDACRWRIVRGRFGKAPGRDKLTHCHQAAAGAQPEQSLPQVWAQVAV